MLKTLGVKNFPLRKPSPLEVSTTWAISLPKFGVFPRPGMLGVLPLLTTVNEMRRKHAFFTIKIIKQFCPLEKDRKEFSSKFGSVSYKF